MINTRTINSLVNFSTHLTYFDDIKSDDIVYVMNTFISEAHNKIKILESLSNTNITWIHYIQPLENIVEKLKHIWGIIEHLNSVINTPKNRILYKDSQLKLTNIFTKLHQNSNILSKLNTFKSTNEYHLLSIQHKKIVNNNIHNFYLSGANLKNCKKNKLLKIQKKLKILTTKFSENILDATHEYILYIKNETELSGLPNSIKQEAHFSATCDGKDGFKFTLHDTSYLPILKYANNRKLRKKIYYAYATQASELFKHPKWDNTDCMQEILHLRHEKAILLGFNNFAELSLAKNMVSSPNDVINFLHSLCEYTYTYAKKEWKTLQIFAKKTLNLKKIMAWDMLYVSEKFRKEYYGLCEQELKEYFPIFKVLNGLFELIKNLFNVDICSANAPLWHPDVEFFCIKRNDKLIAQFYLDLYTRSGKHGGAWMDNARNRRIIDNNVQIPIAYIICNFTPPTINERHNKSNTITHEEIITLFHEMGHGLHHLLTEVNEASISGISNIELDAVELPSQFMENFCWELNVLQKISAHKVTGLPLPQKLFNKVIFAKNFQASLRILNQIELSLFDIHLHCTSYIPKVSSILKKIRKKTAILYPPKFNRFQNSFSHIFSGEYAAGYYSYKWAEVLSADIYNKFREAFKNNQYSQLKKLGKIFQKEILAIGSVRPMIESFIAFQGRQPCIKAFLSNYGIII